MSGENSSSSVQSDDVKVSKEDGCRVLDETGDVCGETENLGILKHFQKIYADRMKKCGDNSELAVHVLKSWVHDLTEQNTMLVHTVEELERELLKRVDMMHEQLKKTNYVIKRKDLLAKREKEAVEVGLRQQVELLQSDVSSLIDVINQAQLQRTWCFNNVKLNTVNGHQLVGTSRSSDSDKPLSLKNFVKPYSCNEPPDMSTPVIEKSSRSISHVYTQTDSENYSSLAASMEKDEVCSSHLIKSSTLGSSNVQTHLNGIGSSISEEKSTLFRENSPNDEEKGVQSAGLTPQVIIHKTLDAASEGNFETSFCVPLGQEGIYICSVPSFDNIKGQNANKLQEKHKEDVTCTSIQNNCLVQQEQLSSNEKNDCMLASHVNMNKMVSVLESFSSSPVNVISLPPSVDTVEDQIVSEVQLVPVSQTFDKVKNLKVVDESLLRTSHKVSVSDSVLCHTEGTNHIFHANHYHVSDSEKRTDLSPCLQALQQPHFKIEKCTQVSICTDKHTANSLQQYISTSSNSIPSWVDHTPPKGMNSKVEYLPQIPSKHIVETSECLSADGVSCNFNDSLESIMSKSHSEKEILPSSSASVPHVSQCPDKESLSTQSVHEGGGDSQENLKTEIDSLKSQLAEKEAEINCYLQRVEEMKGALTQSTQQSTSMLPATNRDEKHGETSWIKDCLKKQQDQVISLTAKSLELETNLRMAILQRDRLFQELQSLQSNQPSLSEIQTQTSVDPYIMQIKQELDTTRQNLLSATNQVKLLTAYLKETEETNRETQAALTVEVAEKYDEVLALKKEVQHLEDQLKQANVQTKYKEEIIYQMRCELKKARHKLANEAGTDSDIKSRRFVFPSISETGSVNDSGIDDGEQLSVSSRSSNVELEQLLHKVSEKDQELASQRERIVELEKELNAYSETSKAVASKPTEITLRELEEYRLCTVEAQAAVEDLKDEIEAITSDMKVQEEKMENFKRALAASEDILRSAELKLMGILQHEPSTPDHVHEVLADAKMCIQDIRTKAEEIVRDRGRSEQRRSSRERKVDKLQEQLDSAHDNMRDGIEAMEQVLAERYEADRLSQREFSDGSSYHSCRESDSSGCIKQVQHLEEQNAELLNTLAKVENDKRDMEVRAAQYLREIDRLKDYVGRRDFTEEIVLTKEQTICELQRTLESTRHQMRELQLELERTIRERDGLKQFSDQNTGCSPSQVAELQSELARVRNQLASVASKQALIEQYERRFQDTSQQTEKLSTQLNTLTLNLQAKEKMLANKEEMVNVLQDTLNRTRDELKLLKEKSVSKSSFPLPWRDGKKKMGHSSSVSAKVAEEAASGANGGASDEELLVRELRLDLSEMLAQYRDCFAEVSRQTRWYRDLRDAYQDLRSHAENIKREALASVTAAQRELEVVKNKVHSQNAEISQLKEQVYAGEHARRRAECQLEELLQRLSADAVQMSALRQQVDSLQSQLKEAKGRSDFSEEQEELRQLRDFRDKCERAARSLADIEQQDKDCWGGLGQGLGWCDSADSEDSQKREARLQATLGLLLVEAGRRRAGGGGGGAGGKDASVKDSDSDSTDRGGKSPEQPKRAQESQALVPQLDTSKCRVHGPGAMGYASAARRHQRESAERRRRLEQEKKNRALRNVARCEACRSFVKSPAPPESDARLLRTRRSAPPCGCERVGGRPAGPARTLRKAPPPAQFAPCLLGSRPSPGAEAEADVADSGPTSTTDTGGSEPEESTHDAVVRQLFLAPKLQARLNDESRTEVEQELQAQVESLQAQLESLQAELQCAESSASVRAFPVLDRGVVTDAPDEPEATDTADAAVQTHHDLDENTGSLVEPSEVRALAEAARHELRGAVQREERRRQREAVVEAETGAARALVLRALCGAELEARLRDKEAEQQRRRFLAGLRGVLASTLGWRQRARRLEHYCSSALWSPEGQLQGALEDNRELREQLCQLREHNATLASQLQAQCVESARFLSEISSPLEDEMIVSAGPGPGPSRHRTLTALAAQVDSLHADKHFDDRALVEQNRALRCSLALSRASSRASDLTDPCDSGCWSLQASPPRYVSGPGSARLCWTSSDTSGPFVTQTPSGATAFILNARRPRSSPGAGTGAGAGAGPGAGAHNS